MSARTPTAKPTRSSSLEPAPPRVCLRLVIAGVVVLLATGAALGHQRAATPGPSADGGVATEADAAGRAASSADATPTSSDLARRGPDDAPLVLMENADVRCPCCASFAVSRRPLPTASPS